MIIGLSGGMGVGKSTAVKLIKEAYFTKPVQLFKFAQPLYDIQEYVYNRIDEIYTRPKEFIKDRKLLQWIGTDWGRSTISDSIWIDLWKNDVSSFLNNTQEGVVICDDVRFDNEAEAVKTMGGLIIRVTSQRAKERAVGGEGIKGHPSEAGLSDYLVDSIIENDNTITSYELVLLQTIKNFAARRGTKDQSAATE